MRYPAIAMVFILTSISEGYFLREEYVLEPVNYKLKVIRLAERFIIKDSLAIFFNDFLLGRDDYLVDYDKGEIEFCDSVPENTRIRVCFVRLPFKVLKSEYSRYQISERVKEGVSETPVEKESLPSGGKAKDSSFFISEEELSLQGSKFIGLAYSNEGLSFEQSTDLRVKGRAGGVEIELNLADRGLPKLTEGEAIELAELEAVSLVLLRKPYKLTFGDFENLSSFSEFGSVRRKGQGIKFEREGEGERIITCYQRPKNKSGICSFAGEDGKKGPYILTADGGRVSIIPGSEEVYLDGERRVRGEDADYIINYSQGEITFTNRVFITSLSRIEVKFAYKALDYERHLYTLFLEKELTPLSLSFSGFVEGDDKGYNFSHPLTAEEERYLETIGDDTSRAFLPSERFVGPNKGDYKKEDNRFVYVGKDSGDYEVSFTFVGEGQGSYIYDNEINGYRYVGERCGRYSPKVRIALPQNREVWSPLLSYSLTPSLSFSLSGLLTKQDLNTFSRQDDEDNTGIGFCLASEYKVERINLVMKRKGFSKNYRFLEEEERDFAYRWGERRDSVKSITLLEGKANPFKSFGLDFGGGLLEKEGRSSSLLYNRMHLFFLSLGIEKAGRDWRGDFSISPTLKYLKPNFQFREERKPVSKTLTYYPNLTFYLKGTEINTGWEEREFYEKEGNGLLIPVGRQRRLNGEIKFTYKPFSSSLLFGREDKRDYRQARFIAQNFGNLTISIPNLRGVSGLIETGLLHKGTEEKEVNYIKVEEGMGSYKKDPHTGQYFYHPKGDYIRVFVPTGKIIPAEERSFRANLSLNPLKPLSFSSNLNYEESRTDTASLFRNAQASGYLTYELLPHLTLKLNKNYQTYLDRDFENENDRYEEDKNSFGFEKEFGERIKIEPELELKEEKRFQNENLTRKLNDIRISNETFLGFLLNLYLRVSYSIMHCEDIILGDTIRIGKGEIGLSRNFSLKSNTSIDLSLNLIRRESRDELPYDLSIVEPLGWSYETGITGSHYQRENLTISFSYSLKKIPEEPIDHMISFSVRMDF